MAKKKRTFSEIRLKLLKGLIKGQCTINQLSKISKVNWKTTELHLVYLVGRGYVNIVLDTKYVRIYEISEKGLKFLKQKNRRKI